MKKRIRFEAVAGEKNFNGKGELSPDWRCGHRHFTEEAAHHCREKEGRKRGEMWLMGSWIHRFGEEIIEENK